MEISTEPHFGGTEGWQEYAARAEKASELAAQRRANHWEAVKKQDADFRVIFLRATFQYSGPGVDDFGIGEGDLPLDLFDDEAEQARLEECLKAEVAAEVKPWIAHLHSLGLVRADYAAWGEDGQLDGNGCEPQFFFAYRAADADLAPHELCQVPEKRVDLKSVPGAALTLRVRDMPLNATRLFDTMQRGAGGVGTSGGDATPELHPVPGESRDEWLERVSLPRPVLRRLVSAWRRSGGNLDLFKAVGAASGRVALERPIRWIVPGLIPRGYVSLLVGTKQAGKSTLLGEMLAVVDSESLSPRSFLGTEVSERGAGALVSGEDGIDFVAARNVHYEPVHGAAQGFVFVTAERPWPEVLKLLYGISEIALICIDGLRAVMPGDEDSSGATSQFFDELNALAQHHNCAIVLVHHLSKGRVRSLAGMLQAVRGSGAITDRVRVAIGMIDRGSSVTEVGIIKHNIPPSETLWGEVNQGRLFRRDKSTLTLIPFGREGSSEESSTADASNDAVAAAIKHFNAIGVTLRQTGNRELWAQRFPALAGVSRNSIRNAVASLIETGRVVDEEEGLRWAGGT